MDRYILERKTSRLLVLIAICVTFASAVIAQENTEEKHLLWQVQTGKNTIYLLGSIHILQKNSYPLPGAIEKAYGCCKKVVFETDLDGMNNAESQKKLARLGMYPKGQTLSQKISGETLELLKKKMRALGLPITTFEQFKPWFVAISLTALDIQRLGYDPELGIDRHFYNKAKSDKRDLVFLETNDFQLNLMADMGARQQELFLRETLKELDIVETMAADMVDAWKTGDAEKMLSIIRIGFDEYPDIYDRFFTDRNKRWIPQIEKMLEAGDNALLIVGAGHLVGEESLIGLLKEKGYRVTQK